MNTRKIDHGALVITFTQKVDEHADTSTLGTYSNTPDDCHIDREERGDMGRSQYRYFNLGDGDADYIEQDYERAEAFNNNEWQYLTIGCEIAIKTAMNWAVPSVIGRAYLSGVESDSGDDYLKSVEADLLAEAWDDLHLLRAALEGAVCGECKGDRKVTCDDGEPGGATHNADCQACGGTGMTGGPRG